LTPADFRRKTASLGGLKVKAKSDIDGELKRWMKTAYDLDVP
jgi:hypothetical protein